MENLSKSFRNRYHISVTIWFSERKIISCCMMADKQQLQWKSSFGKKIKTFICHIHKVLWFLFLKERKLPFFFSSVSWGKNQKRKVKCTFSTFRQKALGLRFPKACRLVCLAVAPQHPRCFWFAGLMPLTWDPETRVAPWVNLGILVTWGAQSQDQVTTGGNKRYK